MKLYEITYTKTQLNLDASAVYTTTHLYQVIANSEIDAAFKLGQVFSKRDDYEIEIKRVKFIY